MNFKCSTIFGLAGGLLLLSACAAPPPAGTYSETQANPENVTERANIQIWVLDAGWHTGLVLPRNELGPALTKLLQPLPQSHYFVFGWGNRKFYMTPNPSFGMDIAALFPSHSVVLIETCANLPRECYTSAVKFRAETISQNGLNRLDDYLRHSLQLEVHGQLEPAGAGPDAGSEFYASGLTYDSLHTCNTWTAEALHAAGLPVSYTGVIFADQLWRQLQ